MKKCYNQKTLECNSQKFCAYVLSKLGIYFCLMTVILSYTKITLFQQIKTLQKQGSGLKQLLDGMTKYLHGVE